MTDTIEKLDLRTFIAQGWTTMFVIFVANLVMDLARCQVLDTCSQWSGHLGQGGLRFITVVMIIYAIMPLLIRSVKARWFRFPVIGLSIFITMFYIVHELTHMVAGTKPFGISHGLDIAHHLVGICVIIAAIKWARQKQDINVSSGVLGNEQPA